jgi:hypothetical protein
LKVPAALAEFVSLVVGQSVDVYAGPTSSSNGSHQSGKLAWLTATVRLVF